MPIALGGPLTRKCRKKVETHGASYTPEYTAYVHAKYRCENVKNKAYKNYGGRGIKFLYKSFQEFLEDVGPKPSPELWLDRKNNDGNYEPGNCRWASQILQANNKRLYLTHKLPYRRIKVSNEDVEILCACLSKHAESLNLSEAEQERLYILRRRLEHRWKDLNRDKKM